jgi:hypothetical protein
LPTSFIFRYFMVIAVKYNAHASHLISTSLPSSSVFYHSFFHRHFGFIALAFSNPPGRTKAYSFQCYSLYILRFPSPWHSVFLPRETAALTLSLSLSHTSNTSWSPLKKKSKNVELYTKRLKLFGFCCCCCCCCSCHLCVSRAELIWHHAFFLHELIRISTATTPRWMRPRASPRGNTHTHIRASSRLLARAVSPFFRPGVLVAGGCAFPPGACLHIVTVTGQMCCGGGNTHFFLKLCVLHHCHAAATGSTTRWVGVMPSASRCQNVIRSTFTGDSLWQRSPKD